MLTSKLTVGTPAAPKVSLPGIFRHIKSGNVWLFSDHNSGFALARGPNTSLEVGCACEAPSISLYDTTVWEQIHAPVTVTFNPV